MQVLQRVSMAPLRLVALLVAFLACVSTVFAKPVAGNSFVVFDQASLPSEGFGDTHVVIINKRSWQIDGAFPEVPTFSAEELAKAMVKPLNKFAPEPFTLYLADMPAGGSARQWPKQAAAVIYTRYSGYIPYVHGLSSTTDVKMAARAIARFAGSSLLLGNPNDVLVAQSPEDLSDLTDSSDPPRPVMVMFSSFTSPLSSRTRPFFEAAATLYRTQLPFVEVRCEGRGSSKTLQDFCKSLNVNTYPTLGLYTGKKWIPYDIQGTVRSTGDIEIFLWNKKPQFPAELAKLKRGGDDEEDAPAPSIKSSSTKVSASVAADGSVNVAAAAPAAAVHSPSEPASASTLAAAEEVIAKLTKANRALELRIKALEARMQAMEARLE